MVIMLNISFQCHLPIIKSHKCCQKNDTEHQISSREKGLLKMPSKLKIDDNQYYSRTSCLVGSLALELTTDSLLLITTLIHTKRTQRNISVSMLARYICIQALNVQIHI
jgi:hypothetical protein